MVPERQQAHCREYAPGIPVALIPARRCSALLLIVVVALQPAAIGYGAASDATLIRVWLTMKSAYGRASLLGT